MDGRMNKDVKIGLAIGVLGLLAVLGLFALNQGKRGPAQGIPGTDDLSRAGSETGPASAILAEGTEPDDLAVISAMGRDVSTQPWGGEGVVTADGTQPSDLQASSDAGSRSRPGGINSETETLMGLDRQPISVPGVEPSVTIESARTYKVQTGDTLVGISTKMYGKAGFFNRIKEANGIADERRIKVGQVLTIPTLTDAERGVRSSVAGEGQPTVSGQRTHTVASGETLGSISLKYYRSARHYRLIMEANHLADERGLRVGQTLVIPESGVSSTTNVTMETGPTVGAGEQKYVVQAGDTPSSISRKFYQTTRYYQAIMDANGIRSDRGLREGQTIIIPVKPGTEVSTPISPASASTTVVTTDTLVNR